MNTVANLMDYTKYKRGSEWRKWDLHIHTPGTKKNDRFEGQSLDDKWDMFVSTINSSDQEISVVGITDYFSLTNYFKFKSLVDERKITNQFEMIIPNIELRILPVTASATPINLHCLFNPSIESEIEDRFLSKLSFRHTTTNYSASRQSLIRLGRAISNDQFLADESAITKGIEQFVISIDSLRQVFDQDQDLRKNTIIVVSNKSNDGLTGIVKHEDFFIESGSQLDATRQSIYQLSDAIFSSNEGDRNYFIGKKTDNKETVIRKCRSLKPCYHGSDAHQNSEVFNPVDNRYCWIKADPTFEGLKQTLFEPEDRVKIQALKPDNKNERYIISSLQFRDSSGELFSDQEILLNENLNSIIGGKSAGKSLLLYSAARSIDPVQVDKTQKKLGFEGYNFKAEYDFQVVWKNGVADSLRNSSEKNQKITYIPQLYINYLVEKDNKEDLNQLVENILIQDSEFKSFFELTKKKISECNSDLESILTNYLQTRQKGLELQRLSKELGKSNEITKAIDSIKTSIQQGQKSSNLTTEEFKTYSDLLDNKSKFDKLLTDSQSRIEVMAEVFTELKRNKIQLFGNTGEISEVEIKGSIDGILDQLNELPDDIISVREKLKNEFETLIHKLEIEISNLGYDQKIAAISRELKMLSERLQPFLYKIAGQKELQKLTENLEAEQKKCAQAILTEKQLSTVVGDYTALRNRTSNILTERISLYSSIVDYVNQKRKAIGCGVSLNCSLVYKQVDLPLFHQVNKAAINREHIFNDLFFQGWTKYDKIPELYSKNLIVTEDKILKARGDDKTEMPLNQGVSLEDVLKGLIKDAFILDFSVTYQGDDLLSMSPGKKGTVLLILFLQISSSEYPILIDQPEDNLDNRTIYDLLCRMIKEKKKDRQIIIVSHNANLVVATDSENIIVANQEGQESAGVTSQYQFDYVNGSLEHAFPADSSISEVLYKQGIREHVCDILEGGNEAFKQRERKYSLF